MGFLKNIFGYGSEPERPLEQKEVLAVTKTVDNAVIYGTTLLSTLESYLNDSDIESAKKMFACHHNEAVEAISQYDTAQHEILKRENKKRRDKEDFITSKLPRAYQRVINQTGTFFMFGNPISLTLGNNPEEAKELEDVFEDFKRFLEEHYFNEMLYDARRITGSETECAKLYSLYKDEDGEVEVICQIKSNGKGDVLYPMFNQYGKMVAFAIGYFLKNVNLDMEEHFDVYTKRKNWKFYRPIGTENAWIKLEEKDNEFQKIPVIYYHHEVDWKGSQERIDKLEWRDSKHSDTVEYFGDPYLVMTADIADNRLSDAKEVGRVMVMENKDGRFEFVTPPDNADMVKNEKDDLKASIDQDTLTPDWSYKSIMGLGTLSGEAMRRANLPGYVKRTQFAVGVYNELIRRDINLVIDILCRYVYLKDSEKIKKLRKMKVNFAYTDPFIGGIEDNSTEIATLVGAGAMSIHAAVAANRYIEDKQAEEERIWEEKERQAIIDAKAKAAAQNTDTNA